MFRAYPYSIWRQSPDALVDLASLLLSMPQLANNVVVHNSAHLGVIYDTGSNRYSVQFGGPGNQVWADARAVSPAFTFRPPIALADCEGLAEHSSSCTSDVSHEFT